MTVNPLRLVFGSIWTAGYILAGIPVGRAGAVGDAEGAPVIKVKLAVDWGVGDLELELAMRRLDCVKKENSGLMVCVGCLGPLVGDEVVWRVSLTPLLGPVGKLIDGDDWDNDGVDMILPKCFVKDGDAVDLGPFPPNEVLDVGLVVWQLGSSRLPTRPQFVEEVDVVVFGPSPPAEVLEGVVGGLGPGLWDELDEQPGSKRPPSKPQLFVEVEVGVVVGVDL